MKKKIAYIFMILIVAVIAAYAYFGVQYSLTLDEEIPSLFQVIGISVISLSVVFAIFGYNRKSSVSALHFFSTILLCSFLVFNAVIYAGYYSFPEKDKVIDMSGMSIVEVTEWAEEKNVVINEIRENSDNVKKYNVIAQDIPAGRLIENVEAINVMVSDGPNYDKAVIVPQMLGWSVDEASDFIKENHLNNVKVKFVDSEEASHIVIEQDRYGQMFRRDALSLSFSINRALLQDIKMIDLTDYSQFDAEFWLMKNGINYTLKYEFTAEIERGHVMAQSVEVDTTINTETQVEITISKGKQIEVVDLNSMTVEEITKWVAENKLNISFSDNYDDTVPLGGVISSTYKKGDIIEENTTINIVISKGPLKMESFSSLGQFKTWAQTYGIKYTTVNEFNDSVARGGIIKFSHQVGVIIKNDETITVTISKGAAVTIPSFVGSARSSIQSRCNSLGIGCNFTYGSYSSTTKDVATSQSISSGSKVERGTNITITLSRGPANTYTVFFTAAQFGSTYNETKTLLTNYLANECPGVTFNIVAKDHNQISSGMIHPDSPTTKGTTVTQGRTYTIYIVK